MAQKMYVDVNEIMGSILGEVTGVLSWEEQLRPIENGTVAETGTHNELLANGEIYSNMWRAHMSVKDSEQEVEPRA